MRSIWFPVCRRLVYADENLLLRFISEPIQEPMPKQSRLDYNQVSASAETWSARFQTKNRFSKPF